MVGFKFRSDFGLFKRKHEVFIDHLTGRMAMDTEVALKTSAGMPVKSGNMKSQTRFYKNDRGKYRTEIDVAYAAVQEKGEMTVREQRVVTPDGGKSFFTLKPGTYTFHNYTTAGTSAGFFMRAIMGIMKNHVSYVAEAKRVAGL